MLGWSVGERRNIITFAPRNSEAVTPSHTRHSLPCFKLQLGLYQYTIKSFSLYLNFPYNILHCRRHTIHFCWKEGRKEGKKEGGTVGLGESRGAT